jgi:hypothetical protein
LIANAYTRSVQRIDANSRENVLSSHQSRNYSRALCVSCLCGVSESSLLHYYYYKSWASTLPSYNGFECKSPNTLEFVGRLCSGTSTTSDNRLSWLVITSHFFYRVGTGHFKFYLATRGARDHDLRYQELSTAYFRVLKSEDLVLQLRTSFEMRYIRVHVYYSRRKCSIIRPLFLNRRC